MSQKGLTILLSAQITAEKPLPIEKLPRRSVAFLRNDAAVHLSLTLKPQLAVWNERLCETQLQTQLHAARNTHTRKKKKNP